MVVKNVAEYIYVYTRPSSIGRYRRQKAWALVTGATEGIGKALARELASRGFNVVIHGRNPKKLEALTSELSKDFPALKFQFVVADVTLMGPESKKQIEQIVKDLEDVNLTVLVNNVGGPPSSMVPRYKPLDQTTTSENDDMLAMNVGFPTQLTTALLPSLIKHQPSLIMTLGSMADYGNPWISMYSGSKAFLMSWCRALAREMQLEGRDIEVLGILTGEVTDCAHNKRPATLIMPDARTYARAVIDKVGCGKMVVNGYWVQGILKALVDRLPAPIVTSMLIDAMRRQKRQHEKAQKSN
jgi:17beta-estradiol 17-dehydrogenase / very-long-chain 3-oxoacyl-CoA reductase